MRRAVATLVASILASSALLASASGVAAADPPSAYILDAYTCLVYDQDSGDTVDPQALVPGVEIVIFQGWFAKTRGEVEGFLNNAAWVLTVDEQDANVAPYLLGVQPVGPYWQDVFLYPAGRLESDGSMSTHFNVVVKSAVFDGWTVYKGAVYGGGIDCSVGAA